ncbi:1354_t:CDS:2 [Gigaspora margarita]|uniref:1354_t:CDS:1 n=1 Tax=Gigaspora margarita TaxID=4874 RepID=A0ABN7UGV7_GIGMA|nr:1354_t:CDS:2 [Gigaspora margarita]
MFAHFAGAMSYYISLMPVSLLFGVVLLFVDRLYLMLKHIWIREDLDLLYLKLVM